MADEYGFEAGADPDPDEETWRLPGGVTFSGTGREGEPWRASPSATAPATGDAGSEPSASLAADRWPQDERARTDALRARIAVLAAGPDEDPLGDYADQVRKRDIQAAVEATLREVLPELLREHFAVAAAAPPVDDSGLAARLSALQDAVGKLAGQLDALAAPRSAAPPAAGIDAAAADATADQVSDQMLGEFESLRGDLAGALEYVQAQLNERTEAGFARTERALDELRRAPDDAVTTELAAAVTAARQEVETARRDLDEARVGLTRTAGELDSSRGALTAAAGQVQEQVTGRLAALDDRLETTSATTREQLMAMLAPLRDDVLAAAESSAADSRALSDGVRADLDAMFVDLRERLGTLSNEVLATARDGAHEQARAAIEATVVQLSGVVADAEREVTTSRLELQRLSDRVVAAGRALVDHLAGRELLLEQVRHEMAAELVTELAAGMTDRDRQAASKRMAGLLQRRRDQRDAQRWREGRPAVPSLPPDVSDENELLALLDLSTAPADDAGPGRSRAPEPDAATTAALGPVGVELVAAPGPAPELSEEPGEAERPRPRPTPHRPRSTTSATTPAKKAPAKKNQRSGAAASAAAKKSAARPGTAAKAAGPRARGGNATPAAKKAATRKAAAASKASGSRGAGATASKSAATPATKSAPAKIAPKAASKAGLKAATPRPGRHRA